MLTARILPDRVWRIAGVILALLFLAGLLSLGTTTVATAANTGCTAPADTADCPDVPADGISYDNTVVKTVNVTGDTVGGTTSVTPSGTVGILLRESGVNQADNDVQLNLTVRTGFDPDGGGPLGAITVMAIKNATPETSDDTPYQVGGQYIERTGDGTSGNPYSYTIQGGGPTFTTEEALGLHLASTGPVGGALSGNLTVNNVGTPGAPFSTTDANGIQVESIGGRGGNGSCTNLLLVSWCSSGSSGGNAGSVVVNNNGAITVYDSDPTKPGIGVLAQSIGGAGGNGGGTFAAFYSDAGNGGGGGDGADVQVTLGANSTIVTYGAGGHGVYARSTGGNGGRGGDAEAGYALGRGGGNGGDAGVVTVTNDGTVTTYGNNSHGIFAQSVGAGAGSGGDAGGIGAVGGAGGGESSGNIVTITNRGVIVTGGADSFGLFAQSIGGGGGDGGGAGGLFSVGGSGGSGGGSKVATINNSANVSTTGAGSIAVMVQSIGGGGGNGGGAVAVGTGASIAIGGGAGPGGDGKRAIYNDVADVNTLTATVIDTTQDRAHGLVVQSIGGGGGNGGYAYSGTVGLGSPVDVSVSLGGRGGDGGDGDDVLVNQKGSIYTDGKEASGIIAQSIGGGGGNGGGTVALTGGGGYTLSVALGGSGGAGGVSKNVTVNAVGNVATLGNQSHGIVAQSIGGGGGNGGFSVAGSLGGMAGAIGLGGDGGAGNLAGGVTVNTTGAGFTGATISTQGQGAVGILAQSIGGGGGNGGVAGALGAGAFGLAVSLGGGGGGGATAGTVLVDNDNIVTTRGSEASAIVAQSIGGGGGRGGAALSGAGGVVGAAVAVGGSGGAGSNGGVVTVTNSGAITTGYSTTVGSITTNFGDKSHGIFAQSIGGGGGDGGFALSGALGVSVEDLPAGAAAISVGGKGGGASHAQQVTVNNTGRVETFGLASHAIYAQSIGGGGGNGGFAGSVAVTIGGGAAFGIAVGGSGNGGGNGGDVDVNSSVGALLTHSNGSHGIYAQSVGGGGGDGGFGFAGAFGFGGETSVTIAVALGGTGAGGGHGGASDVINSSAITTYGDNSYGIMAQSLGGGGGNGGLAVSGTFNFSETPGAVGVSVGGKGAAGSYAGAVTVSNSGAIHTYGSGAIGILGHSQGGGGGNGGLAITAQMTFAQKDSMAIGVSVGGEGGTGNYGGTVKVTNQAAGSIETEGLEAHGIKAQSIGGGGGNGGMALVAQLGKSGGSADEAATSVNATVSVGGAGGAGGIGGQVDVTNHGSIDVQGAAAVGIFAQSVGGGGGDGGGAITAVGLLSNSTNDKNRTLTANVSVGGDAGDGSTGGEVKVENTGGIVTRGVSGYGIYSQSVGGGGGIGGRANTISLVIANKCTLPIVCSAPDATKNNLAMNLAIGGDGGLANHGEKVEVINTGRIETFGDTADGIYAQSIGGGGGNGGNGILGTGELLPVPVEMLVGVPFGSVSFYKNATVAVGGNSGAGGDGGEVVVDNGGNITTHAGNSNGIFAQSVGKGGGVGGKAVIGATGLLGLGGEGAGAGNGGDVTVSQRATGDIETFGVASNGIFAQSVGGGGGIAGNVDRALAADIETPIPGLTIPGLNLGIGLAFGRASGDGGNGGVVDVTANGDIITHGDSSAGIFAQSVGGGGGLMGGLGNDVPGLDLLSWKIGSKGDDGDAGAVSVDLTGTIRTAGNNATGIFAQSAGGLANLTNNAVAATSGDVTVTVSGSVLTAENLLPGDANRGLGSIGILAHSAADTNASNGNVIIDINGAGTIIRGGRTASVGTMDYVGVGLWIMDGKTNTVDNAGTITTADGVDAGWAILATGSDPTNATVAKQHKGGNEAISNTGIVTGSVDLGIGTNSFVNEELGTFNSGHFAKFGDGNVLTNFGVMAAGGKNKVMTTAVNGNMVQDIKGTYAVDVDLAKSHLPPDPALEGEADLIDIDGTLEMLGEVDLTLLNMGNALPGDHQVTIAKSAVALTGTPTLTAPASVVATYALSQTEKELLLSYGIDFDVEGLNPNQSAIGEYINAFQLAGGSDALEPVVASLFQIPDLETYQETLDQLSPEPYLINETLAMLAGLQFENSLMSCKEQESIDAEGQCVWTAVNQRKAERSETDTNLGFAQTSYGLSAGAQARIDEHFVAGIGGSWEDIGTDSNGNVSSTGNRFQAGAVFKGVWGNTVLAGAITGGWSSQNVSRFVDMPLGPSYVLEGTQDIGFASAHVRLSHSIEQDNWYVRPMVDVGVTQVSIADFAETGGPVALEIDGHDETYVTVAPSIELGGEMDLGEDAILRSFVRIGALDVVLGTAPEISAGFAGAPDGVDPFTITGDLDEALFDVTLGFDVIANNGATFRLTGDAKVGETVKSYGGAMKISAPF